MSKTGLRRLPLQALGVAAACALTLTACQQAPGTITTKAGAGLGANDGDGGQAVAAHLGKVTSVGSDGHGVVYLAGVEVPAGATGYADYSSQIRRVALNGTISTVYSTAGAITGLTVSPSGTVSFVVNANSESTVWQRSPSGSESAIAGPFTSGDGFDLPALAQLPNGDLAISLTTQDRVDRIDATTHAVSTLAGSGTAQRGEAPPSGDGGPATAAQLTCPVGLAAAPDGTVYIGDACFNDVRRVDPVTADISTFTTALTSPFGLAVAPDGSLFASSGGTTSGTSTGSFVWHVAADGTATRVAGSPNSGPPSAYQNGVAATSAALGFPFGLAFDPDGRLLIADIELNRVLRVAPPFA